MKNKQVLYAHSNCGMDTTASAMKDLKNMPLPDLLDLLADKIAEYLGMIHVRGSLDDLIKCREFVTLLQLEIESRKARIE